MRTGSVLLLSALVLSCGPGAEPAGDDGDAGGGDAGSPATASSSSSSSSSGSAPDAGAASSATCDALATCCAAILLGRDACNAVVTEGDGSACGSRLQLLSQVNDACVEPSAVGFPAEPPTPTFTRTVEVRETIIIRTPGTYDFENVLHVWRGSGSCNQQENQPPILHVAVSNVTVKNFAYRNAPDGIHIGSAVGEGQGHSSGTRVENVVLDNVTGWTCEDALTTQYGTRNITIRNSFFHGNPDEQYRDKILQLNFSDGILIENTVFKNSPRPVRFKGGGDLVVRGCSFWNVTSAMRGDTTMLVGEIPSTRSDLRSEGNWFSGYGTAFSGIGNIHVVSVGDHFRDGRADDMREGATIRYE